MWHLSDKTGWTIGFSALTLLPEAGLRPVCCARSAEQSGLEQGDQQDRVALKQVLPDGLDISFNIVQLTNKAMFKERILIIKMGRVCTPIVPWY